MKIWLEKRKLNIVKLEGQKECATDILRRLENICEEVKVPCCSHFGRSDSTSDRLKRKSVKTMVDVIVNNNLSNEERALALQQAVLH